MIWFYLIIIIVITIIIIVTIITIIIIYIYMYVHTLVFIDLEGKFMLSCTNFYDFDILESNEQVFAFKTPAV